MHRQRVEVRPRFRCLVCQRFVTGSEHGTCAVCGWQPPGLGAGTAAGGERRGVSWLAIALVVVGALGVARLLG